LEFAQELLTNAATLIKGIMLFGLPLYAIAHHHLNEVRSWGTPKPAFQPEAPTITEPKAESQKPRELKAGNLRVTPPAAFPQAAA